MKQKSSGKQKCLCSSDMISFLNLDLWLNFISSVAGLYICLLYLLLLFFAELLICTISLLVNCVAESPVCDDEFDTNIRIQYGIRAY